MFTIKDIVAKGHSDVYVRRAIAQGKLKATKERIGDTKVERNVISQEDYDAWRASVNTRSRRDDGRNKFTAYMTPEEYDDLRQHLLASDHLSHLVDLIDRANKKKEASES